MRTVKLGTIEFHSSRLNPGLIQRFNQVTDDLRASAAIVDLWIMDIATVLSEFGYTMTVTTNKRVPWQEEDAASGLEEKYAELLVQYQNVSYELSQLRTLLNTPETEDFDKGVPLEAAHQIVRWGAAHDAGKNPEDWFWLCGYLAGKALASFKAGDAEKAKHHCISTAAAMRNWHKHIATGNSAMRPGISAERASVVDADENGE